MDTKSFILSEVAHFTSVDSFVLMEDENFVALARSLFSSDLKTSEMISEELINYVNANY